MKTVIICLLISLTSFTNFARAGEWQSLFNGRDLTGWETWISYQPETNDYGKPTTQKPLGLNQDPKKVFSVVDGTLRVSGEDWGGVSTLAEFEKFHLRFEMKWGEKKWPPRLEAKRDSGILYYAVGPHGAESNHWLRSHEFQIQEGDCGDYHSLDKVTVDANVGDANEGDWKFYRYDPKLPLKKDISARIWKYGTFEKINYEKPHGEWNLMEVIADGQTLIHKVNGHEVLRVYNSQQTVDGKKVPLTRGKIQIQSEGAETFYRNIEIKSL